MCVVWNECVTYMMTLSQFECLSFAVNQHEAGWCGTNCVTVLPNEVDA